VCGTALGGVMYFPYALQLAFGRPRLPLTINVILIAVSTPITVALTWTHGVVGGAESWLIMNGIDLLLGTWLTHRLLLRGIGARWLGRSVLMPLSLTLLVVGTSAWLMRNGPASSWGRLGLATMSMLVAIAINVSLDRTSVNRFLRSAGLSELLSSKA
jgi:hypothetical protein